MPPDKGTTYRKADDELWESAVVFADRASAAPSWRFGKYVHPQQPRTALRKSSEGRTILLSTPDDGYEIKERVSDTGRFVAWDGEGITYAEGMPQQYVLFGASTGDYIQVPDVGEGVSTVECLELILDVERKVPAAIHVGFSFKYDAEMILKDLPIRSWMVLRTTGSVTYKGFTVSYHPGKMFRVSKGTNKKRVSATIYDIWGFFQGSFIKALRGWLDDGELQEIDKIEAGKAERGQFTFDEIDTFIRPYWETELRLLVVLANRLRERLLSAEICPSQWHGAGALATTLYRQHKTREHIARTKRDWHDKDKDLTAVLPEAVNLAAQHAYAGGRFELFQMGHAEQTVYQYDINSAYPDGISMLPSFKGAEWDYVESPDPRAINRLEFAVYHVVYDKFHPTAPQPLPYRDHMGRVSFPSLVSGWYWNPEAAIAVALGATVTECWILRHDESYPFEWVEDLYDERKRRKASGDPSEKAYKLGLNSLYGKMAQRVGWNRGDSLPRFHQLEWAGWVTSWTRAKLYTAMMLAGPGNLIACETDAVFVLAPIDGIQCGTGLGEWEYTEHEWITYLQSGTYWSNHGSKYRGFDNGSIAHDDAMQWLRDGNWTTPLIGRTTRFVGAGTGLGSPLHRCWVTDSRDLQPGRSGKRVHIADSCNGCLCGDNPERTLHSLFNVVEGGRSYPHSLPWLSNEEPDFWQDMYDMESWDDLDA